MTETSYSVLFDAEPFTVTSPPSPILDSGSDCSRTPTPASGSGSSSSKTVVRNDDLRSTQLAELATQTERAQEAWAEYLILKFYHMQGARREVKGYPVSSDQATSSAQTTQTQLILPTFQPSISYYTEFPSSFEDWLELKGLYPIEYSPQYYALQDWYDMEALAHVQNIHHRQIGPTCPPVALYAFDSNNPPPFVDLTKFAGPSGFRVVKISNVSTLFLLFRHFIPSPLFPHHIHHHLSEMSVHLK
jgi:hypothetical protein